MPDHVVGFSPAVDVSATHPAVREIDPHDRDRLLDLAHNKESEGLDRSIDTRITRIRRKEETDPTTPQALKTVRGAGYIFVPGR